MSLKSKMVLSIISVATSSMLPVISVHAADVTTATKPLDAVQSSVAAPPTENATATPATGATIVPNAPAVTETESTAASDAATTTTADTTAIDTAATETSASDDNATVTEKSDGSTEVAAPKKSRSKIKTRMKDKDAVAKTASFKDAAPAAPACSWEGAYIGVYGGGAWGSSRLNSNAGVVTPVSYFTTSANIGSVSGNSTGSVTPHAGIGGIQIGTNAKSDRIVYGAVLNYGSFSLSDSKSASEVTYPSTAAQYSLKTSMSTSWLASVRARLGFVPSDVWPLFYATGGLALTNLHVYNEFTDNSVLGGVGGSTNTKMKPGWIAGVGIEMPVRCHWTIDAEYQYVSFGSNTANGFIVGSNGARSPYSTAANLNASMFTVGVNYRLS